MIKKIDIEIDGINYKMPNNITVSHYGEMMRRMSLSDNVIDKTNDLIGVLLNIPYNILRELEPSKMEELSIYLQNKVSSQDVGYIPSFTYKDVNYVGVAFNKITFGEYVDIINFIKNEASIYMNIHKLLSILYRPEINGKIRPYDIEQHEIQSELFKDLPLMYFFGIFKNLFTFLAQMRKDFVVLFGEDDDLPIRQKEEKDEEEEQSNLPWYKMIMSLTGDDFTKIDYVTARPLVECFNHLTYIKLKVEDQNQLILQQQNKMNL
jgi:hypothetical protein